MIGRANEQGRIPSPPRLLRYQPALPFVISVAPPVDDVAKSCSCSSCSSRTLGGHAATYRLLVIAGDIVQQRQLQSAHNHAFNQSMPDH